MNFSGIEMYITELADRDIRMKIVPEVQSLNLCPTNASVLEKYRTQSIPELENLIGR